MADYRAVASVCEAIAELLKRNSQELDASHQLQFEVYTVANFSKPMEAGISVFPYRLYQNGVSRIPMSATNQGGRTRTELPIDVHFLLTAWAPKASLQNTLAGWMMRVLEDFPIVPSNLLNHKWAAFREDEAVEISLAELSTEDLFQIWDTIIQDRYHLSVPYVSRNIRIESLWPELEGPAVGEREFIQKTIVS